MATKKQAAEVLPEQVEAFCLLDCIYGKSREVVSLPRAEAENGVRCGMLDLSPAAIAEGKAEKA
jgi:hypothetical protein